MKNICLVTAPWWNDLECINLNVTSVIQKLNKCTRDLVVECDGSVHVGFFLLVVTGRLHHVLRVTEQSQIHQLVIQTVLLCTHDTHT